MRPRGFNPLDRLSVAAYSCMNTNLGRYVSSEFKPQEEKRACITPRKAAESTVTSLIAWQKENDG